MKSTDSTREIPPKSYQETLDEKYITAISEGNENAAINFLEAGADLGARDDKLNNSLHLAVGKNMKGLLVKILEGLSLAEAHAKAGDAMQVADVGISKHLSSNYSTSLIDAQNDHLMTPAHIALMHARRSEDPEFLALLLEYNADPNIKNGRNRTLTDWFMVSKNGEKTKKSSLSVFEQQMQNILLVHGAYFGPSGPAPTPDMLKEMSIKQAKSFYEAFRVNKGLERMSARAPSNPGL